MVICWNKVQMRNSMINDNVITATTTTTTTTTTAIVLYISPFYL